MLHEMTHLLLLQALPYVCLLIAMLFFIYAIIGMQVSTDVAGCIPLVWTGWTILSSALLHSSQPCACPSLLHSVVVSRKVLRAEELIWDLQGHMPWESCHGFAQSSSTACTLGDVALGTLLGILRGSCFQTATPSFNNYSYYLWLPSSPQRLISRLVSAEAAFCLPHPNGRIRQR